MGDSLSIQPISLELDDDPAALDVDAQQIDESSVDVKLTADDGEAFGQQRRVVFDPTLEIDLESNPRPFDAPGPSRLD